MKLSAILLAAGSSLRFGDQNKLLIDLGGKTLLRKTFECLLNSGIDEIIVVTGPDEKKILETLAGCTFQQTRNPNYIEGMGTSISCGMSAVSATSDGVFVVPGDMPELSPKVLQYLIKVFEEHKREKIVYPQAPDGTQRNPVLWPKDYIPHLSKVKGQAGGKVLLQKHPERAVAVPTSNPDTFYDIDTVEELEAYRNKVAKN